MIKKLIIERTPHNTIRIFMYFDKEDILKIQNTKDYNLFQLLSIWGGFDKKEEEMYSWELPITLTEYLKDRFKYNIAVEIYL